MKRPTIALCMIVKNEKDNLPRVFESIQGCVDEVHITDTGSTDGTQDVVKAFGYNLHHFDWVNDFSAARNYSFSHAKSDYILWLDGDDVLQNKEAFIHWRDSAMEVANYWLVNYHYAVDQKTLAPHCTFIRERVVKNAPNFKWKYFVHEGIIPDTAEGVQTNAVTTWSVVHMRSEEDMVKDRSRNLSMFEGRLNDLDSRMMFYYGKELFECQRPAEAKEWLYKAATSKQQEPHDRILSYQYLIYSIQHIDELKRKSGNNSGTDLMEGISLAHQGIILDPHRAEFYCLIGDMYLKLGDLINAIPSYHSAINCINRGFSGSGLSSPVFSFAAAYKEYPNEQLARIYGDLGDISKAKAHAVAAGPVADSLYKALLDKEKLDFSKSNPVNCDDVVITCPPNQPYEWDENIYKEKGIGGSETAAVEMARNIHKLTGRSVKVFNTRSSDLSLDGVEYISHVKAAEYFCKYKPKAHIAWRHNFKLTDAKTYIWAHDIIVPGMENTQNYEKLLCLSKFHRDYIKSISPVSEDKMLITRNGISPHKFVELNKEQKQKSKLVFPSSPDRGLKQAMLVCDQVIKEFPELELHVFYGFDNLEKFGRHELVSSLKKMISERPYVKFHGNTEQKELMRHFASAEVWYYPADWYETFCITLFEILAAKCYPVIRTVGSLKDYVPPFAEKGMATIIDKNLDDPSFISDSAEKVIEALKDQKWKNVNLDIDNYSWESVAKEWVQIMEL